MDPLEYLALDGVVVDIEAQKRELERIQQTRLDQFLSEELQCDEMQRDSAPGPVLPPIRPPASPSSFARASPRSLEIIDLEGGEAVAMVTAPSSRLTPGISPVGSVSSSRESEPFPLQRSAGSLSSVEDYSLQPTTFSASSTTSLAPVHSHPSNPSLVQPTQHVGSLQSTPASENVSGSLHAISPSLHAPSRCHINSDHELALRLQKEEDEAVIIVESIEDEEEEVKVKRRKEILAEEERMIMEAEDKEEEEVVEVEEAVKEKKIEEILAEEERMIMAADDKEEEMVEEEEKMDEAMILRLQDAERMLELDARLARILQGDIEDADQTDLLDRIKRDEEMRRMEEVSRQIARAMQEEEEEAAKREEEARREEYRRKIEMELNEQVARALAETEAKRLREEEKLREEERLARTGVWRMEVERGEVAAGAVVETEEERKRRREEEKLSVLAIRELQEEEERRKRDHELGEQVARLLQEEEEKRRAEELVSIVLNTEKDEEIARRLSEQLNSPLQPPSNSPPRQLLAPPPEWWTDCPTCPRDAPRQYHMIPVEKETAPDEWDRVTRPLTNAGFIIQRLCRVQNITLYRRLQFEKEHMAATRSEGFQVNERLLYHTSSAEVGTICAEGLDQRLARKGRFGTGVYFR